MAYKPLIYIGLLAIVLGLVSIYFDLDVNPLGNIWTVVAGIVFFLLGLIPGGPRSRY